MPSLEGTVALVTGGSRGIGRGTAASLASAGAHVYITGRTLEAEEGKPSLQRSAEAIGLAGGACTPYQCDHTDDDQTEAVFERIVSEEGRLDILVNAAWGGYQDMSEDGEFTFARPFWEQPRWRWSAMFDAGLRAAFVCSQLAARQMIPKRSGLIANISSGGADNYAWNALYGTAKAATDRLTRDMAHELKPHGVSVVSIHPGLVRTEAVLAAEAFDLTSSESPEFTGLAIEHLYSDADLLGRSGRVIGTAKLAQELGYSDIDGKEPSAMLQG